MNKQAPKKEPDQQPVVPMVAMPRDLAQAILDFLLDCPLRLNSAPLVQRMQRESIDAKPNPPPVA